MRFAFVIGVFLLVCIFAAAAVQEWLDVRRRKAHLNEDTYTQQGLVALERLANKEQRV
jgi:hypothetical protein